MKQRLERGREYPIKGEDKWIFKLVQLLIRDLEELYGPGETKRQAHPKMHGLVKAEFTVEPNLRSDLKVGIFRHPRSYPCWIRYSNASTKIQSDAKKDIRGMAVKVLDVPGEKLITEDIHSDVQDFLFVSMPAFPIRNVKKFYKFLALVTRGQLGKMLLPQNWDCLSMAMGFKKTMIKPGNLLQTPFWSTVPYQFGDPDRAVKYHVSPQVVHKDPRPEHPNDWYLREAMEKTLDRTDVLLDFMIQFQKDAYKMPIENPMVEWKSDFTKVATIRIPRQHFSSQERDQLGENMDFSPWHSLPAHRPLGGLNRTRRAVYHAMSDFRRMRNEVQVVVPKPDIEDPAPSKVTNRDRLIQLVKAYKDKDMRFVARMLSDDVIWNQPPGDSALIPFSGLHKGKEAVLEMFALQDKTIESEFLEPLVIGDANDRRLVMYAQEKVQVKATVEKGELVRRRGNYETTFVLIVEFDENGLVTRIDSLYDTEEVVQAFASA